MMFYLTFTHIVILNRRHHLLKNKSLPSHALELVQPRASRASEFPSVPPPQALEGSLPEGWNQCHVIRSNWWARSTAIWESPWIHARERSLSPWDAHTSYIDRMLLASPVPSLLLALSSSPPALVLTYSAHAPPLHSHRLPHPVVHSFPSSPAPLTLAISTFSAVITFAISTFSVVINQTIGRSYTESHEWSSRNPTKRSLEYVYKCIREQTVSWSVLMLVWYGPFAQLLASYDCGVSLWTRTPTQDDCTHVNGCTRQERYVCKFWYGMICSMIVLSKMHTGEWSPWV